MQPSQALWSCVPWITKLTKEHTGRLTGALVDRTLKPLASLGVDPEQISEHVKGVSGASIPGEQV